MDVYTRFQREALVADPDGAITPADALALFLTWRSDEDPEPGAKEFKDALRELGMAPGFQEVDGKRKLVYTGWAVNEDRLLAERRHPLAKCEECPLFRDDTYVGGSPGAGEWVVLAEHPNYSDWKGGRPLAGRVGETFVELLREANAADVIGDASIEYVVACRPPLKSGGGVNKPPVDAERACAPRLEAALEGKTGVLALGAGAGRAATGEDRKLTDLRLGPVEEFNGRKVLATYSPGSALMAHRQRRVIVKDLKKLKADVDPWVDPTYEVPNTVREVKDALRRLMDVGGKGGILSLDIETAAAAKTWGDKDAITRPRRLRAVGLSTDGKHVVVLGERGLKNPRVREMLEATMDYLTVLAHNGKFDLQAMKFLGFRVPPLGADTMLAAYALDESKGGKSLDALARDVLGAPNWKGTFDRAKERAGGWDLVEDDILYLYNARDVAATFRLWTVLKAQLEDADK